MNNKHKRETILIGIGLIALSLFLHYVHFLIFKDLHHTLIFLFADIAFIPMEVFFTAFVIERLLEDREKAHKMEKLNMIKGIFFSEFGTDLLEEFSKGDRDIENITKVAIVNKEWGKDDFKELERVIDEHKFSVDISKIDLEKVINILESKKDMIISFIGNPILMEHEVFSDLLISLFHLLEEFDDRYYNIICQCCDEKAHIEKDINDSYEQLGRIWGRYMKHLKSEYPQLFIKAMLHNPFDKRDIKDKLENCGLKCINEKNKN
ncbi:hypothetical protein J2Z53_000631 [Clostridium moniliforme]|uniref:Uncharacterized protein n=1 Tax=Clostridium moniliforme TaxID=39489 RepID=A0ABS4EYX9_9CLOT|nr:hypothetical protein [Clostridium moniliforme]MBP1889052.1 hypothetical protein [Clostridium moniliforme]